MAPQAVDKHGVTELAEAASAFELSSAELRSESGALDATLHGLLARLSGVPGLTVVVKRRRPWWRRILGDLPYVEDLPPRKGAIEAIAVSTVTHRYELVRTDASILSTRADFDGPPRELTFSEWAAALLADIEADNRSSHESLLALRAFVEHAQAA
jgi:hypothetical protein